MNLPIPTVETERLLLRGWREADFEPWANFAADPEVTRYLGGVQSRLDAWCSLAGTLGHWVLRGFGLWAVERKSDGAFIGRIGPFHPEGWPGMEVGWTLGRTYWGNGYATEAAKASLDYGFRNYPVAKLISLINVDNRASQRLAERLGETKGPQIEMPLQRNTYVVDVWEITREQWAKAQI
jgi:RimJ/RimL family protein N-acetyltransferase